MKLDWLGLANYAEDRAGLLYVMGGGWDTIHVGAPVQGMPEGVFTVIQGYLVIRLLFHPTETDREHTFRVTVMDADGAQLGAIDGGMRVDRSSGLPANWDQNVNIVLPLSGFPLPREGNYVINLQVDGQFIGDRPFRVLKAYT